MASTLSCEKYVAVEDVAHVIQKAYELKILIFYIVILKMNIEPVRLSKAGADTLPYAKFSSLKSCIAATLF
jgi:hypothetical protein